MADLSGATHGAVHSSGLRAFQRKVTIKTGETYTLAVDLPEEAVKKRA